MPGGSGRVLRVALVVVADDPARRLAVGADPLVAHRVEARRGARSHCPPRDRTRPGRPRRSAPPDMAAYDGWARGGLREAGAGRPRRHWCTGDGCSCGHCRPAGGPAHEAGYSGQGRQPGGGSSPTSPSTASRIRSAWPVCRPYSSIRSQTSRRRLACSPSGVAAWMSWSRPPSARALSSRARERSTAPSQSA